MQACLQASQVAEQTSTDGFSSCLFSSGEIGQASPLVGSPSGAVQRDLAENTDYEVTQALLQFLIALVGPQSSDGTQETELETSHSADIPTEQERVRAEGYGANAREQMPTTRTSTVSEETVSERLSGGAGQRSVNPNLYVQPHSAALEESGSRGECVIAKLETYGFQCEEPSQCTGGESAERTEDADADSVGSRFDFRAPVPHRAAVHSLPPPDGLHSRATPSVRAAVDTLRMTLPPASDVTLVRNDERSLEVLVRVEGIGEVDVELVLDNGAIRAQVSTSDMIGKELIERNLEHLLDTLSREGLNVGGFTVSLRNGGTEDGAYGHGDKTSTSDSPLTGELAVRHTGTGSRISLFV